MISDPGFKSVAGFRGHVYESNAGLTAGILPSYLAHAFDDMGCARQGELNAHRTHPLWTLGGLNGDPTFTQVGSDSALLAAIFKDQSDRNFDGHADIAATLAFHQGADSAEAGFRAF